MRYAFDMELLDKRFEEELEKLITAGRNLASDAEHSSSSLGNDRVIELLSLCSRGANIATHLYGSSSFQVKTLKRLSEGKHFALMHSNNWRQVGELIGVLQGARDDIRSGLLGSVRRLLRADVFADFVEMAEHYLELGHKEPAAVMLGAVLEDGLRKLAEGAGLPVEKENGKPLTLDPLNISLTKAEVYDRLVAKQITAWAQLRNSAAHGKHDEYDEDQVRQMLAFVQKFLADYRP